MSAEQHRCEDHDSWPCTAVTAMRGRVEQSDDTDAAAVALMGAKQVQYHGQRCPVWLGRSKLRDDPAGQWAVCDCARRREVAQQVEALRNAGVIR